MVNNENDNDNSILPEGWVKTFSKRYNRYYYSHIETKTNQWHEPTFSEVRDPSKARRLMERNKEKFNSQQQQSSSHKTPKLGSLPIDLHSPSSSSRSKSNHSPPSLSSTETNKKSKFNPSSLSDLPADKQSVAIIVPYRDLHIEQNRAKHLAKFLPHMQSFLEKLVAKGLLSNYHVYIIEQSDDQRKFNRGKLLNIGFDYASKYGKQKGWNHDVFIFHDVDLLPGDDLGTWYARFPKSPIHIARCWDRYSNNAKYFGGIVSFSESDMKRINGFPNTFWGWGGEDDEMQKRCERLRIKWEAPPRVCILV